MYEIEKNVPFGGGRKYPWGLMKEVGDSFFVPGGSIRNLTSVAYSAGKKMGVKFSCRTVDGGVRVFRVS